LGIWALTRRGQLRAAVVVGVLMALVSLPTILQYAESGGRAERGLTTYWHRAATHSVLGLPLGMGILANIVDTPIQFIVDFGAKLLFLPLVGVAFWRLAWRDPGLRWLLIAAVLGVVANRTIRSELRHNDFGQKIVMLATVFTAIMAGCAVAPTAGRRTWWNPLGWRPGAAADSPRGRVFMAFCVFAGLPRGFYEAPMTAARRYGSEILELRIQNHKDEISREDMRGDRAARVFMRYELPMDAVVQPDTRFERAYLAQMVRRQLGVMDPEDDVRVFMPEDPTQYLKDLQRMENALWFERDAGKTSETFKAAGVTHVFLGWRELLAWDHFEKYDDERYFEDVFRQGRIRVMRVK
jgi:hypothetical protein